jgi:hypothetical protein
LTWFLIEGDTLKACLTMAVQIKERKNPPKEFDLKKYDGLKDESIDDLVRHFGKRRHAWHGDDSELMARERLSNPLDKPPIAWREGVEDQFRVKDQAKIQQLLISDLLMSDIDSMSHELRNGSIAEKAQRHHRIDELGIDRENNSGLCGYLRVGLWASKDVAVEVFTRWFEAARERKGLPVKTLNVDSVSSLIDKRILPYIDLLLFYRAVGKSAPTQGDLGEWLFPDEQKKNTEDRIRQTVHPAAIKMIEGAGLALLLGQKVDEFFPQPKKRKK